MEIVWRLLLLLGIGCGSFAQVTAAEGPVAAAVPAPASNANEYRIGPGDQLNIFVFSQPELSVNVPVRPDGLISSPLVENIQAAGKTPSELARDIEKTLSQFIRTPTVNVIVTSFVGTYAAQIRVVGQAANPQALSYRAGMTVLDVMIAVGGLSKFAAGNRAKIVRKVDGKTIEIKVKLNRLLNDGDVKANVEMQPGDVLIIPESRF
jgi:polysaccharide export outer membrane protein